MSTLLTPRKTQQGWIIDLPDEMAQTIGVEAGSMVVLYANEAGLRTEVLPPVSQKIKDISQYLLTKNRAVYEELKKLGD